MRRFSTICSVLLLILGLSTIGYSQGDAPAKKGQSYVRHNLVSDLADLAAITDANLVNSWGIARSAGGPWWVADNGTGVSTVYDGQGQPFPGGNALIVTIPPPPGSTAAATPTGIVFNGTSDFQLSAGQPALFLFVTEDGTISGWNPNVDPTNAVIKVDNSTSGAEYKGVTIALDGGAPRLYAADFKDARIDVFDTNFAPVTLNPSAFTDPNLPAGYAPFNIQTIGANVYVCFAKQSDDDPGEEQAGARLGFVDVFDPAGNLVMSLKHGHWMDAPWAVVQAPADFGKFSNDILVGMFGSGQIAAFDAGNGNFHGILRAKRRPIRIDGLWGLGFGNGANAGPTNTLFFAAGIEDEAHGLFGTITVQGKPGK